MRQIEANAVAWYAQREGQEAFKITGRWYGITHSRVIITLGVDDISDIVETDAYVDGMLNIMNKIQCSAEYIYNFMKEEQ